MAQRAPDTARRWAERLSGRARDNALLGMLSTASLPTNEVLTLANSIESPDLRYAGFQSLVFSVFEQKHLPDVSGRLL